MFMGAKVNVYGSKGACIWEGETAKVNVYGSKGERLWDARHRRNFCCVTTFNSHTAAKIYTQCSVLRITKNTGMLKTEPPRAATQGGPNHHANWRGAWLISAYPKHYFVIS